MLFSLLGASGITWLFVLWRFQAFGILTVPIFVIFHAVGFVLAFKHAVKRGGDLVAKEFDHKEHLLPSADAVRVDLDTSHRRKPTLRVRWSETEETATVTAVGGIELQAVPCTGGDDAIVVQGGSALELVRSAYVVEVGGTKHMVASRFPVFETIRNVRDLGGYRTKDGKMVAWRRVYRSGQWSDLTTTEYARLVDELGIKTAVDLRNDKEKSVGKTLPAIVESCKGEKPAVQCLEIGVEGKMGLKDVYDIVTRIFFRRHELADSLGQYYIDMVKDGPKEWVSFIEVFADEANLPAAFHCKAGKDRTGICAAMLLSLLGVDEDTIVREYSLTNLEFERTYEAFKTSNVFRSLGVADEDMRCVLVANPGWLRGLLKFIKETHGSLENFLITEGGMREDTVDCLRSNLLVPLPA